ncbi:hypothetical protein [Kineosporia sp. NBRC 101731]|uniref:hypothetical protein n=1 Tax=Kineosporia sp. NBRC 101731 TaxID=3032199 RepID=UPI0025547CE7|nr:hypothetical protein [Kineosporia sp. NBRC 101731]
MAPLDLFAGHPNLVAGGTITDPAGKASHEVDVAVLGLEDDNRRPLLAVGEAKWGEVMGLGHLDRLRRIRDLLTRQNRYGAEAAKLVCFAGPGFSDELLAAADDDMDIVLITPADLY